MSFNNVQLPYLSPDTIVPSPQEIMTFVQYLTRLYEDIAININARDFTAFSIPISDTAADIPNVARFGAFMVLVSGIESTLPTAVWALTKSSDAAVGVVNLLSSQAGTGAWAGNILTITSTTTNFQIKHNRAGITAGFNIRIVGTQL
jgi:hypothetical protein